MVPAMLALLNACTSWLESLIGFGTLSRTKASLAFALEKSVRCDTAHTADTVPPVELYTRPRKAVPDVIHPPSVSFQYAQALLLGSTDGGITTATRTGDAAPDTASTTPDDGLVTVADTT